MKNLKKTIASGVIGIALLAGLGGTFATWVAESDPEPIGIVQAGGMEVDLANANSWVFTGTEDQVDLANHYFMPGESLTGTFTKAATLNGNFEATFGFRFAPAAGTRFEQTAEGTYRLFQGDRATGITLAVLNFSDETVNGNSNGSHTFQVIVNFDEDAPSADQNLPFNLGDLVVTLTQA